jgi:gliding motility-associated-like protein
MQRLSINIILFFVFPASLCAQYSGGHGQGASLSFLSAETAAAVTISYNRASFCIAEPTVYVTQTGLAGGIYTSQPDGLTIDSITGTITPGSSIMGTYTITYTIPPSVGCHASDSRIITIYSELTSTLSPEICQGETIRVGTHEYTNTGIYTDKLTSSRGCDSIIITNITVKPKPVISLGSDTTICKGDVIILSPGKGFSQYKWSNGTTSNQLEIADPGNYSVEVSDGYCSSSDSISIDGCISEIWFPNAFSPNNDGINDHFRPVCRGFLLSFHVFIFNLWGQQLYESRDPGFGWDGSFKGQPCPLGVYTYIAEYALETKPSATIGRVKRGTVTLLR